MNPRRRFAELDLLRFVAAIGVMLYHFSYRPEINGHPNEYVYGVLQYVTRHGYLGVELFFIISGFVILWTAVGRSPKAFVATRVIRLYPTFWLCLGITSAAMWCLAPQDMWPTLGQILANATMLSGYLGVPYVDGVYWTLAVEMKFYFLVLVLLVLGQLVDVQRSLVVWLLGLAICDLVGVRGPLASLLMFPSGAFFAAGCLLFLIFQAGLTRVRLALLAGVTLLCCRASLSTVGKFIESHSTTDEFVAVTSVLVFIGTVLLASLGRLRFKWPHLAAALGSLTYPLYLLHNNIGKLILRRLEPVMNEWMRLLVAIGVALALAWLVTEVIERQVNPRLRALPIVKRMVGSRS